MGEWYRRLEPVDEASSSDPFRPMFRLLIRRFFDCYRTF